MKAKGKSPVERRLYPRRPYRTRVIFDDEFGEGLFYVDSEDISMGGIFLASDIPVRIGSLLFVSFQLPLHKRFIRATAEVVRRASTEGGSTGMGVRFVGLTDTARKRLEDFLSE